MAILTDAGWGADELTELELAERGWRRSKQFRWFRPKRGTDNDLVLQQLWKHDDLYADHWQNIRTVLGD